MWIPDGTGALGGNEIGGDYQVTDGYSVRYHLANAAGVVEPRTDSDGDKLFSLMEVTWYAEGRFNDDGELAIDPDSGKPIMWLSCCVHRHVCTDLSDPGSTELWCDYEYTDMDIFFDTKEVAEEKARQMAEIHANDADLFRRNFDWDGLATWER